MLHCSVKSKSSTSSRNFLSSEKYQLLPFEDIVDLPKILGFEGLCAILPSVSNVSAVAPDFETVDRKPSNAAPPSSDLGE